MPVLLSHPTVGWPADGRSLFERDRGGAGCLGKHGHNQGGILAASREYVGAISMNSAYIRQATGQGRVRQTLCSDGDGLLHGVFRPCLVLVVCLFQLECWPSEV